MKTRRAFIQTGAVALCGLAAAPALAKPRKPKDADWTDFGRALSVDTRDYSF